MVQVLVGIGIAGRVVAFVEATLVGAEQFLLGALQFAGVEAMAARPLDLCNNGIQSTQNIFLAQLAADKVTLSGSHQRTRAGTRTEEGRIGLACDLVQALVEHVVEEIRSQILTCIGQRLDGIGGTLVDKLEPGRCLFRITHHQIARILMFRQIIVEA